ncbi:MAG: hypothetical protein NWE95_03565 [Candidatus Bathyarchaeota archaeon]|nr:hypothetical protein [Candidatus Bathyarchaeota archaeon]
MAEQANLLPYIQTYMLSHTRTIAKPTTKQQPKPNADTKKQSPDNSAGR